MFPSYFAAGGLDGVQRPLAGLFPHSGAQKPLVQWQEGMRTDFSPLSGCPLVAQGRRIAIHL